MKRLPAITPQHHTKQNQQNLTVSVFGFVHAYHYICVEAIIILNLGLINSSFHLLCYFCLRYTMDKSSTTVYAIVNDWPTGDTLSLGCPKPTSTTQLSLLGYSGSLEWTWSVGEIIKIDVGKIPANQCQSQWAWAFVLTDVA